MEQLDVEIDSFLNHLRVRKNSFKAEQEWRVGSTVVESLPQIFTIETTTVCNLKCVICPHGRGEAPPPAHIEPKIVSGLSGVLTHAHTIQIFGGGEPLLSPGFWNTLEMLRPLENRKISINSNGQLLTKDKIETILNSALGEINFSLDAARAETYLKIRGASFDRVLGNIRRLLDARRLKSQRRPEVLINMALMRENIQELPEFIDLAADLGVDGVFFSQLHDIPANQNVKVKRGDWEFVYGEQQLKHFPKLNNEMIKAAIIRAKEKNVRIVEDGIKLTWMGE